METPLSEAVIDAIYDAALDRDLWPDALSRIGGEYGGAPTQIGIWDLKTGTIPLGIGVDFMPGVWEIAARYATPETNPTLAIAMRIPLHQAVDHGVEIGLDHFKSLAVYTDLYLSQRHMPMLATVVARSESVFGGLAVMRPDHWDLASPEDLALGGRISRHVGRAVELAGLFDTLDGRRDSFEAALHQAPTPILLLNAERRVVWTNPAADQLLRSRNGLQQRRQTLVATDLADDARLSRACAEAAQGRDAVLTLRRAQPSALVVRLSPLWRTQVRSGARVLVQVTAPRSRVRFDAEEAADLFHLTPAEARVACEICAGARTLAEVGKALQISVNTVKTLLQRIYDKTDVRSQNELAILFASVLRPERPVQK